MVKSIREVEKVGYGLMGFTWVASRKFTQEQYNATLKKVIDGSKATSAQPLLLNGGEFYGIPERHEGLQCIGNFFKQYPEYADKVYLSIKGGADDHWLPDNSPARIDSTFEAIGKYLEPLYAARKVLPKTLDMFTLCRIGKEPIEDTVALLSKKASEGKFDSLCLSELSAATLSRALTVAKVDAVEIEFSLFHREAVENGVIAKCVENDIAVVAYSPLGKGLLAGQTISDLSKDDMRRNFDRFNDQEVVKNNDILVEKVNAIAKENGLSPAQVSLSWITSLSGKTYDGVTYPRIIPIPGSTNADRQLSNLDVVPLSEHVMTEISTTLKSFHTAGHRYNKAIDQANYR